MGWNNEKESDYLENQIVRRQLLPWWIKIFCWLFMVFGTVSVIGWIFTLVIGETPYVNLFSPINTVKLFSPWGVFMMSLVLFKSYVGYALWFEKDNAVDLGKIDVWASVFACVVSIGIGMFSDNVFQFRLELFLLIPYYLKLNTVEYEWKNQERQV